MYIEIHDWKKFTQKSLYFKLNNAFNMEVENDLNHKFYGIYAIFNNDICLYVGQSKNLASRIATHLSGIYEEATHIFVYNIETLGWGDFLKRTKSSQQTILDNSEKFIMSELKPIDNINIDMDFELDEEKTPYFGQYDYEYDFLIKPKDEKFLTIRGGCVAHEALEGIAIDLHYISQELEKNVEFDNIKLSKCIYKISSRVQNEY